MTVNLPHRWRRVKRKDEGRRDERVTLPKMTNEQAREFIRMMIEEDPKLGDELKVFLQGRDGTKITTGDYFAKYRKELSRINMDELLECWCEYNEMGEFDDGYYGDSMEEGNDENQLSLWVDEMVELIRKYGKNKNFIEVFKIAVAGVRALIDRQGELKDGMSDLDDWFARGINQLIEIISQLNDELSHEQLLVAREQWELLLSTKGLEDYLGPMIESLGKIWRLLENYMELSAHVEKYLTSYPPVALTLMRHYLESGQREELIKLSERVLEANKKTDYDQFFDLNNYYAKEDLVVSVRRMLDSAYSLDGERNKKKENLEQLFLASHSIEDYKNLRKIYADPDEKVSFWQTMEKELVRNYGIKTIFLIYKLEGEKERILKLLQKNLEAECFAQMVREVREQYPSECYKAYKGKMAKLLIPTDTYGYDGVAYHLAQMREIGLDDQFVPYLTSIKTEYKRRRRMMEAITKRGL
jgi:hypothetical protein